MFLTRSLYAAGISVLLVFLAGCNTQNSGGKNSQPASSASQSHSLDLSLASLYSGVVSKSTASKHTTTVSSVLTGSLQAINYTTNKITNYDWSATLDDTTLTVHSIKTLTLEPGSYHFTLLLSDSSYQYAGDSYATITDGNVSDISMTLAPVIGDTVIDVSAVSTLSDYHFTFDSSELSSIYSPKLGITVDGGLEQIFTINKLTGLTDSYINLSEGSHTIKLALYEDTEQIGRSVEAQESVTIVVGSPLTMDIVPLHAETAFSFDVVTGGAIVKTILPNEILDIAGPVDLNVILTLTDGNTSYEKSMSINAEDNITYGITSFGPVTSDPIAYGDYAMQLLFIDTTNPSIPLGSCLMDHITLDKNGSSIECSVSVSNPSLASSSILASVGINVYDTSSYPVGGALVYANDELIGITGGGTFGTEGYLSVDLPSGDLTIKAVTGNDYGIINTILNPLDIKNLDITVNQSGTANIFDLFGDGSIVATYTFDTDGSDLGGTYNASLVNATLASAKINNGLNIDSFGDYAYIGTPLPALGQYSISLFVETNSTGVLEGEVFSLNYNNNITLETSGDTINGFKYLFYHAQSNSSVAFIESNSTFGVDQMHHISVTADLNTISLYVDGVLEGNTSYDGTSLTSLFTDTIGGDDSNISTFYGKIDQLRIFNRAVTQNEINQLLNEQ